jgi:hypothetical protein
MLAEAANTQCDRTQVIAALKQASAETGSDFHYLLGTAMRESSLKSQAQASTSSACGLFQFTGQTWLGLVKEAGAKYGLGSYADAIEKTGDGHFKVADSADRSAILSLRKDPRVAALMAGEFTNRARATLQSTLGRSVCDGELYAAHFLGPGAACKLIAMSASAPHASAADAFPQAADANRNVFYRTDGTARTVREVYDWALKQPSIDAGARTREAATPAAPHATPTTDASWSGVDANALVSGLVNWAPQHRSFSALDDESSKAANATPFLLTPGVMDLLTQVSPSQG